MTPYPTTSPGQSVGCWRRPSHVSDSQNTVKVHQCLFGYEDGHRLLASSIKLPTDAASALLPLSDLAPGVSLAHVEGYWTGIPLPTARSYALMRTWPAPEMPRPGCVWSHALLISFAEIARFVDLVSLGPLTLRPDAPGHFDVYREPQVVDPAMMRMTTQNYAGRSQGVSARDGLRLLRAVYGETRASIVEGRPGVLDDAVLALWSQQWPRLRRAFAFRTAGSLIEDTSSGIRFDLRVVGVTGNRAGELPPTVATSEAEAWESAALEDLRSDEPTEFRRFLWRYGSDLRASRERFQLLAELYTMTRVSMLTGGHLETALQRVAFALPSLDEGRTLKEDLVSGGRSVHSLMPRSDTLEIIDFFVRHPESNSLPQSAIDVGPELRESWRTRPEAVLHLAEQVASSESALAELVLDSLTEMADPLTLFASTEGHVHLRERLLRRRPSLLLADGLVGVPQPELLRLLALAPDEPSFVSDLVRNLLRLNDAAVARVMLQRFPHQTVHAIAGALQLEIEQDGPGVPSVWLDALTDHRQEIIQSGLIGRAKTTRLLAAFASVLGHDSPEALSVEPRVWSEALRRTRDDVVNREQQVFLAFLLAVALHSPTSGSELLFEHAFEPVHTALWHSRFAREATAILVRHLPDLGWWDQWDTCRRLRLAVVGAYVTGNLRAQSFKRLTEDPWLWQLLVDVADESGPGRRFIKKGK